MMLPLLAGILALLLAGEWLLPGPAAAPWQQPAAIQGSAAAGASDAEIAQWSSTILARPLLSESRRPVPASGLVVDDTLPRLSAIIVIGNTRHAIFAATGGKPQAVAAGSQIGVYRITSVALDKVDLLGPDGPVTVRLQFNGGAPAAPVTPAQ